MLFIVEWSVSVDNRTNVWNVFGNMTPEDHTASEGNLKMIGRYHLLDGSGGRCILESENAEDIMNWVLNWSHISDVKVQPVVEDVSATKCVQNTRVFEKDLFRSIEKDMEHVIEDVIGAVEAAEEKEIENAIDAVEAAVFTAVADMDKEQEEMEEEKK